MTTRRDRVRGVRYATSRRHRAGLTLLAALLGLMPLLGTVAHAASTATTTTTTTLPLTLTVDRISPTAPQPGDLLTVAGVLTNPTTQEYDGLSIALRIQSTPLESRAALLAVAGSTDHFVSDNAGTPETLDPLAAGASVPYVLQVPVDALQLITAGVYRIAVEVYRGSIDDREYDARINTFLPWLPPAAAVAPVQVAWVWPLLTTPRLQPDNTFSDDGTGVEIGPVGRLGRLLDVASQAAAQTGTVPAETAPPVPGVVSADPAPTPVAIRPVLVTPVIDPENVQELQLMTGPYTVKNAPGGYSSAATTYLAGLTALVTKTSWIATPYGDPDIQALMAAQGASLVTQARSTGLESSLPVVSTGLLWPPDGTLSQGTLAQLSTTGLILSSKAVPVTNAVNLGYTPTSTTAVERPGGAVPAVVVDDGLSKLATTPVRPEDRVLLDQRFAAETAAIAVEAAPSAPSAPRTLVIAPGRRWSPTESPVRAIVDETGRLPWITPVTVPQALQAPPDPAVARAAVHQPPNQPTLPDDTATRIVKADAELAGFRSILCPAPAAATTTSPAVPATTAPDAVCNRDAEDQVNQQVLQLQRSLYRAASTAFRRPGSGGQPLLDATVSLLRSTEDKVRIVSEGGNTLVGNGAKLPISIVNDLPVAVKVQLVLRPRSAALRATKAPVELTIAAGAHVQTDVTVTVNSAASRDVFVDAQLLTPAGRDFGKPVTLQVHISAAGVVVVTITIAVCGLLGLAVIVRLYRRIRNARKGSLGGTEDASATESTGSTAGAAVEPEA
ncbi:MAG: hypothetical protein QOE24_1189 [Frankiales bacterium]|nr:hypothetical protein [Frankiales bacterium]